MTDAVLFEVTRGEEITETAVATVTFQSNDRPESILFFNRVRGGPELELFIQDPRNADRYFRSILPMFVPKVPPKVETIR